MNKRTIEQPDSEEIHVTIGVPKSLLTDEQIAELNTSPDLELLGFHLKSGIADTHGFLIADNSSSESHQRCSDSELCYTKRLRHIISQGNLMGVRHRCREDIDHVLAYYNSHESDILRQIRLALDWTTRAVYSMVVGGTDPVSLTPADFTIGMSFPSTMSEAAFYKLVHDCPDEIAKHIAAQWIEEHRKHEEQLEREADLPPPPKKLGPDYVPSHYQKTSSDNVTSFDNLYSLLNEAANDGTPDECLNALKILSEKMSLVNLEDSGVVMRIRILLEQIFSSELHAAECIDAVANADRESQEAILEQLRTDIAKRSSGKLAVEVSEHVDVVADQKETYRDLNHAYNVLTSMANDGSSEQRLKALQHFHSYYTTHYRPYAKELEPYHNRLRLIGVAIQTILDQETRLLRRIVEESWNAFNMKNLGTWHGLVENIGFIKIPKVVNKQFAGQTENLVDNVKFAYRLDALMQTNAPPTVKNLAKNCLVFDHDLDPPWADSIWEKIVEGESPIEEERAIAILRDPNEILPKTVPSRAKAIYADVKRVCAKAAQLAA